MCNSVTSEPVLVRVCLCLLNPVACVCAILVHKRVVVLVKFLVVVLLFFPVFDVFLSARLCVSFLLVSSSLCSLIGKYQKDPLAS